MKFKDKIPTLDNQIKAVEEEVAVLYRSYVHLCGRWKGHIPPGADRDLWLSMKSVLKTLKNLRAQFKKARPK